MYSFGRLAARTLLVTRSFQDLREMVLAGYLGIASGDSPSDLVNQIEHALDLDDVPARVRAACCTVRERNTYRQRGERLLQILLEPADHTLMEFSEDRAQASTRAPVDYRNGIQCFNVPSKFDRVMWHTRAGSIGRVRVRIVHGFYQLGNEYGSL